MPFANLFPFICILLPLSWSDIKLIELIFLAEFIGLNFEILSLFLSVQISKRNFEAMTVNLFLRLYLLVSDTVHYNLAMVSFYRTNKCVQLILGNLNLFRGIFWSIHVDNTLLSIVLIAYLDLDLATKTMGDALDSGLDGYFVHLNKIFKFAGICIDLF